MTEAPDHDGEARGGASGATTGPADTSISAGTRTSVAASLAELVREHPGLAVSAAYFGATGVGMLTSSSFYGYFGVNIFHYAQLQDFVLVAIRNPVGTLAVLLAAPAVWFVMVTDDWLDRRYSRYRYLYGPAWLRRLSRSRGALVLYFVIYAWIFSDLYSLRLYEAVQAGRWTAAEVQLQSGTYLGRDGTVPFDATMLGATSSAIVLFDRETDRATVVPLENVASLTVE